MSERRTQDRAVDRVYRREGGKILAALIKQFGDFDLAEDALHDAVAEALIVWRRDGRPRNGGAWLMTVSRRRAIDRLRRSAVRRDAGGLEGAEWLRVPPPEEPELDAAIPDERLRLIFTCCHPALAPDARVALTLRTLCGLTTGEIARAFLVGETTMAQRLVRAKKKIRQARIPYQIPEQDQLGDRLASVLDVVYLIFNEGYAASRGEEPTRADLCEEAIRLGRVLYRLMPEPEAGGLLALMLLHDSRRAARSATGGELVPLEKQDRSLWNRAAIAEGSSLLRHCLRLGRPGPFQIQAAISAVHGEAADWAETDWPQIARLYGALAELEPSPIVTLNRAVAISHASGAEDGLRLLRTVAAELDDYQPFHAAHADLLRRLGRGSEAVAAYRRALDLTTNAAEREWLERRLADVERRLP